MCKHSHMHINSTHVELGLEGQVYASSNAYGQEGLISDQDVVNLLFLARETLQSNDRLKHRGLSIDLSICRSIYLPISIYTYMQIFSLENARLQFSMRGDFAVSAT